MRLVSLISSGIDSPVATYLLSKNAEEIILLHADNRPFTDDREIENFQALARYLKKIVSSTLTAYLVPHGPTLLSCKEQVHPRFTCVLCKRMMVRYAEAIAQQENAEAIIVGDSLGQVASQTLQNIRVVDQAVTMPILRPLIGFDKEDVIRIAKQIGTYDLSIVHSAGCTAVPVKPATRANLTKILIEETKINAIALVQAAVTGVKRIEL